MARRVKKLNIDLMKLTPYYDNVIICCFPNKLSCKLKILFDLLGRLGSSLDISALILNILVSRVRRDDTIK